MYVINEIRFLTAAIREVVMKNVRVFHDVSHFRFSRGCWVLLFSQPSRK